MTTQIEIDWDTPRVRQQATTARITCRVCAMVDHVSLCRACGADVVATTVKVKQWLASLIGQIDLVLAEEATVAATYPAFWAKLNEARLTAGEDDAALAESLSRARAAHPTYALLLDAQRDARRALEPLEIERARLERALDLLEEL